MRPCDDAPERKAVYERVCDDAEGHVWPRLRAFDLDEYADGTAVVTDHCCREHPLDDVIDTLDGIWRLVEVREEDDYGHFLTLDENWDTEPVSLECGWIAPDGTVYSCPFMAHATLLRHIADELMLEERSIPADHVRQWCYQHMPDGWADSLPICDEDFLYAFGWCKVFTPSMFGRMGSLAGCSLPDTTRHSYDECVVHHARLSDAQKAALARYGLFDQQAYNESQRFYPLSLDDYPVKEGS